MDNENMRAQEPVAWKHRVLFHYEETVVTETPAKELTASYKSLLNHDLIVLELIPLYAVPPAAQVELAKRDERIESLTSAGAEYQRQCFEQAAEIARLKGVIAICKRGFETIHDRNRYGSINAMNCRIALAAIKEEGL